MRDINHFIDGAVFAGASGRFGEVFDPNTGAVQARVQLAAAGEVDRAERRADVRPSTRLAHVVVAAVAGVDQVGRGKNEPRASPDWR